MPQINSTNTIGINMIVHIIPIPNAFIKVSSLFYIPIKTLLLIPILQIELCSCHSVIKNSHNCTFLERSVFVLRLHKRWEWFLSHIKR